MKSTLRITCCLFIFFFFSCDEDAPEASEHFRATVEGESFEADIIEVNYAGEIIITATDTTSGVTITVIGDQLAIQNGEAELGSGVVIELDLANDFADYRALGPSDGYINFFESNTDTGPLSAEFSVSPKDLRNYSNSISVEGGSFYLKDW